MILFSPVPHFDWGARSVSLSPRKSRSEAHHSHFFGGGSLVETAAEVWGNVQHGTIIVKLITVVWRTENSNEALSSKEFIAIFHNLMSPNDQVKLMLFQEFLHNFL